MHRLTILCTLALIAVLAIGGYAVAQDATPAPAGTPTDRCVTPQASPGAGGTPTTTATANPNALQGTAEASPEATPCASPSAGNAAGGNVMIEMVDIAFNPQAVTIPANTDVVIELQNHGALSHNFTIDDLGIKTPEIPGGGRTTVTINAPAGSYQYYCNVPGHKELGMVGTLTVK